MTYLNIVQPLNDAFVRLCQRLDEGDTRAMYLKSFEVLLSFSLGNDMLWDNPDYLQIDKEWPLPDDHFEYVDYEAFRCRLILYEKIMKDKHLLGTAEQAAPVTGTNARYLGVDA